MSVLRNILLAVIAFFAGGWLFNHYLVAYLPDTVRLQNAAPLDAPKAGGTAVASGFSADKSATALTDWLAFLKAPAVVPLADDADTRRLQALIDRQAQTLGKQVSPEQTQALAEMLSSLRGVVAGARERGNGSIDNADKLKLMALAAQGDGQFRKTLGIGLASFAQRLSPSDIVQVFGADAPSLMARTMSSATSRQQGAATVAGSQPKSPGPHPPATQHAESR